jgi:hypothetical protein
MELMIYRTPPRVMALTTKICPTSIVTPPQATIFSMVYLACAVARLLSAQFATSIVTPPQAGGHFQHGLPGVCGGTTSFGAVCGGRWYKAW